MARKILVRLVGVLTCMAAVVAGFDAEAGWRNRRCCYDACCYTPCYSSCYSPCYSSCSTCQVGCGWTTVVSTPVIVDSCCGLAATAAPAAPTQAATQPAPTPATAAAKPVSTTVAR